MFLLLLYFFENLLKVRINFFALLQNCLSIVKSLQFGWCMLLAARRHVGGFLDPNSFGSSRQKIVSSGSRNLCGGVGGGEGRGGRGRGG